MKTSAFATTVLASLAAAASPYWYITELQSLDTTSPMGESTLQFTFEDPSTSLVTVCSYVNAPGSARPVTVLAATPCENPQVRYTYIKTSPTTGQVNITLEHLNAAGNLQGDQYGTGIADLSCQAGDAESGTACYAANTEIIPGSETGA